MRKIKQNDIRLYSTPIPLKLVCLNQHFRYELKKGVPMPDQETLERQEEQRQESPDTATEETTLPYKDYRVSIMIQGKGSLCNIRVSDEVVEFAGGVKCQMVVFIKVGGIQGASQWWSPELVKSTISRTAGMVAKEKEQLTKMDLNLDGAGEPLPI